MNTANTALPQPRVASHQRRWCRPSLQATAAAALLALTLPAQANVANLAVTVYFPTDTLDNLWLTFHQGDFGGAYRIDGKAYAATVSSFFVQVDIPTINQGGGVVGGFRGDPAYGLMATYGGNNPVGVYMTLNTLAATALAANATPFETAFPSFGGVNLLTGAPNCQEADLIAALSGTGGCLQPYPESTVRGFAGNAYLIGHGLQEPGTGWMAPYSGTADTGTFVKFSNATLGGTVSVSVSVVPEPSPAALLAAGLGLAGLLRRRMMVRAGR